MSALVEHVRREYAPNIWWYSPHAEGGVLAVRHADERMFLFRQKTAWQWRYCDLISADIDRVQSSEAVTTGGRSIVGAAAGALVLGPAGAVIGGLGGKRKTVTATYLTGIFLKLAVAVDRATSLIRFCVYEGPPSSMLVSRSQEAEKVAEAALIQLQHLSRTAAAATPASIAPVSPDAAPKCAVGNTTPLHEAVEKRRISLAEFALARRYDVNAVDENGRTPLHIAAENGYYEFIKLLLNNGARTDVRDINGATPLDSARRAGHPTQLLIR